MAILIRDDKRVEIKDGDSIVNACKELDISFGCKSGLCGTCNIIVLEGTDNLSNRTMQEEDMNLPDKNRLACQCRIKSGIVKIRY